MQWPYCPNCKAVHSGNIAVVRDAANSPAAWKCTPCNKWVRIPARNGDTTVYVAMQGKGTEFFPAQTTVSDPTLGTRKACGYTCDLVQRSGKASCSCQQNGKP